MLQAVIFDFDGVITDSEILHYRAFNKVLAGYGVEITMKDYYKTFLGLTDADCFKQLIREGLLKGRAAEQELEKLLNGKKEIFEELARTKGKIIEGVDDFLRMLGQNDIPMAICSGALLTEIELILEEARLRDFFEVIVSAEDVRAGKPSPEGFLLTLQKLNASRRLPIKAAECVVIEDSHWGLEAAKAAGMHSIAVTNSYDADQLSLAERIVNRVSELSIGDLQQLCM
jgi:beta-phosphoglucomutase